MAIMDITYKSYCLQRNVTFKVILPVEDTANPQPNPKKPEVFKTLYLLHGYSGNASDWAYGSRIFKLARDRNLAVVMPSGENSFYLDYEEREEYYGTFVGKELVEVTRRMFPLSHKREDTCIAGLSMGGFGSLLLGSRFAETFGGIISLSGGFLIHDLLNHPDKAFLQAHTMSFYEHMFGDLKTIAGSEKDPYAMCVKAFKKNQMPRLYMACGTEDYVYENNVHMRDALREAGIDVFWEEAPSEHEWTFWDPYIEKAIDWYYHD